MHSTDTDTQLGGLASDDFGHADDRAPLVLLHGMTFDRTIWWPLVAELHRIEPGRRVLAIDLPGHGQSPELPHYDLGQIPDLLHRVIAGAGLTAPVLVAHSAGALAAAVYAGRYPTRGVINLDQPLQLREFGGFVQTLAGRLRGPDFGATFQVFYDSFHTELLPPEARKLVRSTCRPRQQVVLGYWRQALDGQIDEVIAQVGQGLAILRASGVPYLHIAGDEPGAAYRAWLAEQLPAATIEVWAPSGHFPHLARPEEFARRLAATAPWSAS